MILWASQARLSGTAGLEAIAWGSLAALIPGIWFTRAYWTRNYLNLRETWKLNWNFGRWLMWGTLANWVAVEFYPILTAGLISFAAAGAYRALQNLVAPIHLLLRATDTFLTPRAASSFDKDGKRALSRTLGRVYLAVGVPVLGILGLAMLFPEQILHLFYGETYLSYSRGVILLAIFYALWFAYWPLQTAFKAARLSRPIFTANLLAILCMFTIGIWAISRWGVYGTIAGQALNALVLSLVLWGTWIRGNSAPQTGQDLR
jgi:O-antigen/teichoic acid export membrane protein